MTFFRVPLKDQIQAFIKSIINLQEFISCFHFRHIDQPFVISVEQQFEYFEQIKVLSYSEISFLLLDFSFFVSYCHKQVVQLLMDLSKSDSGWLLNYVLNDWRLFNQRLILTMEISTDVLQSHLHNITTNPVLYA